MHESRRRRLDLYAPLMRWLKGVEPLSRFSRFSTLCQAYASALCPVYAREMHEATERCKTISGLKGKGATSSGGTASNAEVLSRRLQFDSAVDDLLRDVLPVRVAEQDFCTVGRHVCNAYDCGYTCWSQLCMLLPGNTGSDRSLLCIRHTLCVGDGLC